MFKCTEPGCKKKFKREQDMKMHWKKIHSIKIPIERKKYKRKSGLTLEDAILAIRVKRDSFDDVIAILEGLGR